jgi:hypothetical protein
MTEPGTAVARRRHRASVPLALALGAVGILGVGSAEPAAASTDSELGATLQLPRGGIDFRLETDVLQSFDEEGVPFFIQVFDGCAINGHYWVFAASLASESVPLEVYDVNDQGKTHRTVLPAYVPGEPIGTVFDPEALAICRDAPAGGLPELEGTATYTTVTQRCGDGSDDILLLSEGSSDAYRTLIRDGQPHDIFSSDPIAIRGESAAGDELFLLAEGRTPGLVEGVRFSGDADMLPRQATLERSLRELTRARIRRAFETAKSKLVPDQMIRDLGLGRVGCIFHVGLDFDTPGAPAYLAEAGWIREGGVAVRPPELVEPRFDVQFVAADGEATALPLTAPLQDTPAEGTFWEYASDTAKVRIIDGCPLGGTFWTVAAAVTDEPLELLITDTQTGHTATHLLWTDREPISRMTDTSALACQ